MDSSSFKWSVISTTTGISAARNHVNRMCLAADVPLVESGTAGYLGQATVIKKVLAWSFNKIQLTSTVSFRLCIFSHTSS